MYPVTRKDNVHVEHLPNEAVVYDKLNHQAHCLNRTVFTIWENADGTKSVDQLAGVLTEKFGVALSSDLVLFSLNELKKVNLLQSPAKLESEELPSRRQIGRKLAMAGASAAFLPFVASLVAPTPAMARSYNPTTYASERSTVQSQASGDWGQVLLNKNHSLTDYTTALADGTAGNLAALQGKTAIAQSDFQAAESEFNAMLSALGLPPL